MLTAHKLIAVVILPGLMALVLACGPSAPKWQDGPTPPPGSGKLPKSLDGSPLLRGLVIEYEKMLAADDRDAAPAAAKLDWVEIFIYCHEESSDGAQRFLKSNGVEYGFPQAHSGDISTKSVLSSRIPLNLLRPIAEISTVRAVALHDLPDSPKIVPNLSELIVGYEVGIPHQPIYCTQGRKDDPFADLDPYDIAGRHWKTQSYRVGPCWYRVGDAVLVHIGIVGRDVFIREANAKAVERFMASGGVTEVDYLNHGVATINGVEGGNCETPKVPSH